MKVTCMYIVCTYEHLFSQAAKWVKNMEKDNKLVVIKYSDPNYISLIQNAVYVTCHIYYYMYQRVPGPQLCYSHTECGLFDNFIRPLLINFASHYHHYTTCTECGPFSAFCHSSLTIGCIMISQNFYFLAHLRGC